MPSSYYRPLLFKAELTTPSHQSSEARLYTFSQETKDHLRKFRLGTSRSNDPQAVICMYVSLTRQLEEDALLLTGHTPRHDR